MRKQNQLRMAQRKKEMTADKKRNKANKVCYSCSGDFGDDEKSVQKLWKLCKDCNLWCCNNCLPEMFNGDKKRFICNNCVLEEQEYEEARNRLEQEINERTQIQA